MRDIISILTNKSGAAFYINGVIWQQISPLEMKGLAKVGCQAIPRSQPDLRVNSRWVWLGPWALSVRNPKNIGQAGSPTYMSYTYMSICTLYTDVCKCMQDLCTYIIIYIITHIICIHMLSMVGLIVLYIPQQPTWGLEERAFVVFLHCGCCLGDNFRMKKREWWLQINSDNRYNILINVISCDRKCVPHVKNLQHILTYGWLLHNCQWQLVESKWTFLHGKTMLAPTNMSRALVVKIIWLFKTLYDDKVITNDDRSNSRQQLLH